MESAGSRTISHPLIGRVLGGRYELRGVLGTGGMATVFQAWDRLLRRAVAAKVLHPQLAADPLFVERFHREAQFAAQLSSHPNVVAIHDVGHQETVHYIIMERVAGRNLKEIIAREAPLPVTRALDIGEQIAAALDFAHRHGLIHRDIKPQNILVMPDGRVKVTDFGIAQAENTAHLTRPGMVLGTAEYLSPEQARGEEATPASDIYALGVVLYEMLTGHVPFRAGTPLGMAIQHVHAQPPPLGQTVPPLAAQVVSTALHKDPSQRYTSAEELRQALWRAGHTSIHENTRSAPVSEGTAVLPRVAPEPRPPEHRRPGSLPVSVLCLLLAAALGAWLVHGTAPTSRGAHAVPATSRPSSQPGMARPAAMPTVPPSPTAIPTLRPPPNVVPAVPPPRSERGHGPEKRGHGKGQGDGKGEKGHGHDGEDG